MDKREFTIYLRRKLRRLGEENAEDAVSYYEEIINEKISEGMSECQAVASLGDPKKLAAITASEMVADNKVNNPSQGMFLILGTLMLSPVLFPLVLVLFIFYVVIFSLWIGFSIALGGMAIGAFGTGIASLFVISDIGTKLLSLGVFLIAFLVFALLCVVFVTYGQKFINLITVKVVRKIRHKSNKEVK